MTIQKTRSVTFDLHHPPYKLLNTLTDIPTEFLESLHNEKYSKYKSLTCKEYIKFILEIDNKNNYICHHNKNKDILIVSFRDEDR